MLNKNQVIEMVQELKFPDGEYWLVAGAALVIHGVRELTDDIDISCTTELFNSLIKKGYEVEIKKDGTRSFKLNNDIEVFDNWAVEKIEFIDGVSVGSLKSIKKHKLELGREKDLRDIELIDSFLRK